MTPEAKSVSALRNEIKQVSALQKSAGWKILRKILHDDFLAAAQAMAAHPNMATDEVHYRRGALSATPRFLDAPAMILNELEAALMIQEAQTKETKNGN